jgi:hypothetical protein
VQDLHKPQPEQIQKIFELFADLLMNITHETVSPAMAATAEEVCKETGIDVTPETTRNLLGLYTSVKKLLIEVHSSPSLPCSPSLLTTLPVWYNRLHLHRPLLPHPQPPGKTILLHNKLRPLPRNPSLHYRHMLQQGRIHKIPHRIPLHPNLLSPRPSLRNRLLKNPLRQSCPREIRPKRSLESKTPSAKSRPGKSRGAFGT